MKSRLFLRLVTATLFSLLLPVTQSFAAQTPRAVRDIKSFDAGWRFLKGDAPGSEQLAVDDSGWRALDVPHDWSIEGPFDANNPTGGAGGFLPSGVAWYRKHIELPATAEGRKFFIEFDGVMHNSDVWVNGVHLGHRPNGYVSFRYELTPHLKFGPKQDNVIAVRVDTSAQPASRWYSGAGIYRHVRLIETGEVAFDTHATFVSASEVTTAAAVVRVQTRVLNRSVSPREMQLRVTLLAPDGRTAATAETPRKTIAAGEAFEFAQNIPLENPSLWDLASPHLYRATVRLSEKDNTLDEETVVFGVRDARFEAATGFWLNGKNIKVKGVCLHHDGGAFGAAVPLDIWTHRLISLKALGVNAIRTAHNPPAPEFLDLCDRLGFLVMDELFDCWTVGKNPHDYHLFFNEWSKRDAADTVRRDRNHPSIILYSAGNEIHDTPKEKLAYGILEGLVAVFHENDPTRPVTQALFRPNVSHDYDNGLADLLDVIGTNYRDLELLAAHKAKPTRKIIGTEQSHERQVWLRSRDNPQHAGQFLWTGIDYLGESRAWPNIAAASGLLDKTGAIKPMAWERASWWKAEPVVKIVRRTGEWKFAPGDPGFTPLDRSQVVFDEWTPRNAQPQEETVEVYSNLPEVELFLNEKSLGTKTRPADASPRVWKVRYEPGALKAVGRKDGVAIAQDELRSAGKPAKIILSVQKPALRSHWDDVAIVTATVVDSKGIRIPDAADSITFSINGPGVVAAVDNGDIANHEPFQASTHKTYQGRCVAYVKATASAGKIILRATADGLADGTITIEATR